MLKIHMGDVELMLDNTTTTNKEVREIERFTGERFSKFQDMELTTSDADHVTVLVWLARRQNGEPDLQLDDVEFPYGTVWAEPADDPTDEPHEDAAPDPTVAETPNGPGPGTGLEDVNSESLPV